MNQSDSAAVAHASLRAGEAASCRPLHRKVKRNVEVNLRVQAKLEAVPEPVEGACPEPVEGLRDQPAGMRALRVFG